jgi:uncharacterized protein RhaS with RHS repeats
LHYNYHRYYDPDLGRYLKADPIGLKGGTNPYRYAHNSPMNETDFLGLKCTTRYNVPYIEERVENKTIKDDWNLIDANFYGFALDDTGQERRRLVCDWRRTITDIHSLYRKNCFVTVKECDGKCGKEITISDKKCGLEKLIYSAENVTSEEITTQTLTAKKWGPGRDRAIYQCETRSDAQPSK